MLQKLERDRAMRELCELAVQQNGDSLAYVKKQTEELQELVELAVQPSNNKLVYISF
jgi:hypothetical protein